MSEFFNKKEEVLDIQLTQYGKYLLSQGKLDPKFYAFFDDDIIYDASYGDVTEDQNQTQVRIFESPRMKAQYMFYGAETKIHEINRLMRSSSENYDEALKIQNTPEKSLVMQYPLGSTDADKDKAPAWNLRSYGSNISSSAEYTSVNSGYINHISQIHMDYVIRTKVSFDDAFSEGPAQGTSADPSMRSSVDFDGTEGLDEAYTGTKFLAMSHVEGEDGSQDYMSEIFPDDSYIEMVEKDFILLDLKEENTDYFMENFEIEVFKIEETSDGREVLHPLTFAKRNNMPSGLVEDETVLEDNFSVFSLGPKNVEWYFDILVDDEIDASIACGNLNQEQITEMFHNSPFEIDCDKYVNSSLNKARDIYSHLDSGPEEEPCD